MEIRHQRDLAKLSRSLLERLVQQVGLRKSVNYIASWKRGLMRELGIAQLSEVSSFRDEKLEGL